MEDAKTMVNVTLIERQTLQNVVSYANIVFRCQSDSDHFVYSGEHCEIAVERLSLSSTYIAAIAGGSGGAIVVVLSVVIVCLILRKKKQKDVDKNESMSMEEFGRSLTKGGLRLSSDMYPRKREDTLTVEGKEHKIITDSRGNECEIQRPILRPNVNRI
ncbi:hypothetical protein MAR_034613 [Mya arenaria]|uniref:Uncharacterized protein n=1 Tax=Mya arenaria TaxID=6604 RepID=A0ABY7EKN7_MYAAR|nr:hypothetical protein MAR_034613 [Mya arenaria]